MKRIQRLLNPSTPNGVWTPFLTTVVLIVTAALALQAWQADKSLNGSPFFNWLNQDVVYIIDDTERSAFEMLTADVERAKFID